jgi:hypothetical protein
VIRTAPLVREILENIATAEVVADDSGKQRAA